jgi:hypothetical protein
MKYLKLFIIVLVIIVACYAIYFASYYKTSISISEREQGNFLKGEASSNIFEDSVATATLNNKNKSNKPSSPGTPTATSFVDEFSTNTILQETGSLTGSANKNWWVNSGGELITQGGIGETIQGDLSSSDKWFIEYARTNPTDTDNGKHPQNIFRLVQRGLWRNFTQQVYFKINKINLSSSPNRAASNGLFLFNRYQSGESLYYTGIRVDGAAVIKKKMNGEYYTMSYKPIFSGSPYNKDQNPNLLPLSAWIGLRSEVITNSDNSVTIRLFVDKDKTGNWTLVLETKDNGSDYGSTISGAGFAGIRTDFLDAEFDNYSIKEF